MNTTDSYGKIAMSQFIVGDGIESFNRGARAVIDAFIQRETVEGWRLLQEGEKHKVGDEWLQMDGPLPEWIKNPSGGFPPSRLLGVFHPIRRKCRFLSESPQPEPEDGFEKWWNQYGNGNSVDKSTAWMGWNARKSTEKGEQP